MPDNIDLSQGLPEASVNQQRQEYLQWWEKYGTTPAGLAWNKGKQAIRFGALLSYFDAGNYSVLDVGCGFGDLNAALEFHWGRHRYLGIDIVEPYLEEGRRRYGDSQTEFVNSELLAFETGHAFDLAFASGTFNIQIPGVDQYDYLQAGLEKMLSMTTEGIAVDMLSDRVNFQRDGCSHYSPERVLGIALNLTRNVAIRHDYLPFEFSVALYRDDSFDDKSTVFHRHLRRRLPFEKSAPFGDS